MGLSVRMAPGYPACLTSVGHPFTYYPPPSTGNLYGRHIVPLQADDLSELMNGPIRAKLKMIPEWVTWGGECLAWSTVSILLLHT